MKLSKKIDACELSPIRKFYPFAEAAKKRVSVPAAAPERIGTIV